MSDFTGNWLRLIKDLLVELPSKVKIIVVLGIFILGVMIVLIHIRGQIIGKAPSTVSIWFCRVDMLELTASILGGKPPVYG